MLARHERPHPGCMSIVPGFGAKLTRYGSGTIALIRPDQSAAVRDTSAIAKLQLVNDPIEPAMTRDKYA